MSEQLPQQSTQDLNISESVLETVQIGGIAGRDLNLTQIQGGVGAISVFGVVQVAQNSSSEATSLKREEYEWRRVLLSKVKQFWIDGVLTKSLHTQALIELGLEDRNDYVPKPLKGVDEFSSNMREVFPEGTSATDIFENIGAGRTLLILGEPGSGKTVTLLKLAESLIARTENNLSQPLPVLINLSSWSKKRESISDWLTHELYETYQVSKSLGETWVNKEQLILLLDGLDEVEHQHRNDCVRALNQFIQSHGRTEMVVCSRLRDYEALSEQLSLRSALYVQPLTFEQINRYLEQAGAKLTPLQTLLSKNSNIRQFASSPLILSIMSLAYQGYSTDELQDITTTEAFHHRLFETYIERMFARRSTTQKYSRERTKHWLIWMAQHMVQESQTVFLIERMTPALLQTRHQRVQYRVESVLLSSLMVGSMSGLLVGSLWGFTNVLNDGLAQRAVNAAAIFLVISVVSGIMAGTIVGFSRKIKTVETLKWSWKEAKRSFFTGLKVGLLYGFIGGAVFGFLYGLIQGLETSLIYGILQGLGIGLLLGLLLAIGCACFQGFIWSLVGGFRGPEMQKTSKPNQGIRKSFQNSLMIGLIAGLASGLILTLLADWDTGLVGGASYGMCGAMIGGGVACLQHLTLRLKLYRMGYIPWNYARFLDYGAERLFLQKVGGGYIFIHRMLLEHFAAMDL